MPVLTTHRAVVRNGMLHVDVIENSAGQGDRLNSITCKTQSEEKYYVITLTYMNWKIDWWLNFIFLFLTHKGNISLPPLQLGWGLIIRFCVAWGRSNGECLQTSPQIPLCVTICTVLSPPSVATVKAKCWRWWYFKMKGEWIPKSLLGVAVQEGPY